MANQKSPLEYRVVQNDFGYWVCQVWMDDELVHTTTTSIESFGAFTYALQFVSREMGAQYAIEGRA